ncbi:MAG: biopolymer transporter ExbD [Pirellulales bacterium]|nr:biopolymer transporter ExbD [Pirellulales bacterium]
MKIRKIGRGEEKIELQMTPMIDIVFQLLAFFIMTFKITVPEGDFNIKMPLAGPSTGAVSEDLPPIKIRLRASANGELATIEFGQRRMGRDFPGLREQIRQMIGDEAGPGGSNLEAELDCDFDLRYEYVVEAITAVSGYITPDGRMGKLIEKIKFAPPRPGQ